MTPRIPLGMIRQGEVALRKVDTESAVFLELADSIAQYGVLEPIQVSGPHADQESGEEYYELINGLHRFTAAVETGKEDIPVHVVEPKDKSDVLSMQIITNIMKVETKPVEYTKQLLRLMDENPLMTKTELASMLNKSRAWIDQRLRLGNIANEETQSLIDEGKINLQNAYALSTLPAEEQDNYVEAAITQDSSEFVAAVTQRNKELKESKRKGKEDTGEFPGVQPKGRSNKDLKSALDDPTPIIQIVGDETNPSKIIDLVLKWTLCIDPISESEQRAKWEAAQAKREENKQRKAEEIKASKAAKQIEKAEKMKAEAQALLNGGADAADADAE